MGGDCAARDSTVEAIRRDYNDMLRLDPLNPAEKAPGASLGHQYQGLSDLLLVRSIGNFGERGADPSACWRKRRSRCHDDNAAAADLRGRERRISRRPSATRPSDHSRPHLGRTIAATRASAHSIRGIRLAI
jgi:hypothetical protein